MFDCLALYIIIFYDVGPHLVNVQWTLSFVDELAPFFGHPHFNLASFERWMQKN